MSEDNGIRKYTLIISQQRSSHAFFVVPYLQVKSQFMPAGRPIMRAIVKDLIEYKSGGNPNPHRPEYLGDLDPEWSDRVDYISSRYNVNDRSGDIYILNCESMGVVIKHVKEYTRASGRAWGGEEENIHDHYELKKIVSSHINVL